MSIDLVLIVNNSHFGAAVLAFIAIVLIEGIAVSVLFQPCGWLGQHIAPPQPPTPLEHHPPFRV